MTDDVVESPRSESPVVELMEHMLAEARKGSLREVAMATRDADGVLGVAYPSDMTPVTMVGLLTIAAQCAVDAALEASA